MMYSQMWNINSQTFFVAQSRCHCRKAFMALRIKYLKVVIHFTIKTYLRELWELPGQVWQGLKPLSVTV